MDMNRFPHGYGAAIEAGLHPANRPSWEVEEKALRAWKEKKAREAAECWAVEVVFEKPGEV